MPRPRVEHEARRRLPAIRNGLEAARRGTRDHRPDEGNLPWGGPAPAVGSVGLAGLGFEAGLEVARDAGRLLVPRLRCDGGVLPPGHEDRVAREGLRPAGEQRTIEFERLGDPIDLRVASFEVDGTREGDLLEVREGAGPLESNPRGPLGKIDVDRLPSERLDAEAARGASEDPVRDLDSVREDTHRTGLGRRVSKADRPSTSSLGIDVVLDELRLLLPDRVDDADPVAPAIVVNAEIRRRELLRLPDLRGGLERRGGEQDVRGPSRPGPAQLLRALGVRRRPFLRVAAHGLRVGPRRLDLRLRGEVPFEDPRHRVQGGHGPRRDEDPGHRVVVVVGKRIELVIVAPRATDGLCQEGLAEHVELLVHEIDQHLLLVRLGEDLRAEREEAGRDDVVDRLLPVLRLLEEIAGQLLPDEVVVGKSFVERLDHPVAIAPRVAEGGVLVESVRVGVPRHVEPVPRPSLPVVRRLEQSIDESGPRTIRIPLVVREELGHLRRVGRKTDEVEVRPSRERPRIGLADRIDSGIAQALQHEAIDLVPGPVVVRKHGNRRFHHRSVRPVLPPLPVGIEPRVACPPVLGLFRRSHPRVRGPHLDPLADRVDLGLREPPSRRHGELLVLVGHGPEERARGRVTGNQDHAGLATDQQAFGMGQVEAALQRVEILAVALEAVLDEDRTDPGLEELDPTGVEPERGGLVLVEDGGRHRPADQDGQEWHPTTLEFESAHGAPPGGSFLQYKAAPVASDRETPDHGRSSPGCPRPRCPPSPPRPRPTTRITVRWIPVGAST